MSSTTLVASFRPPHLTLPHSSFASPDDDQVTTPLDPTPSPFLPPSAKPSPPPFATDDQSPSQRAAAYLKFLSDCNPIRVVDDGHESDSKPERTEGATRADAYEGRGGAEAEGEAGGEVAGGAPNAASAEVHIQEAVANLSAVYSQPTLQDPTLPHRMAGSFTIPPSPLSSSNLLCATPPLSTSLLSSSLSRPPSRRQTSTYYQAVPSLATPRRFADSKQDVALTALLAEKDPGTRRWTRAVANRTKFKIEASVDESMLERDLKGEVSVERVISWPLYEVSGVIMDRQQVVDQLQQNPVKMQRNPVHTPKRRAHFATGSVDQLDHPPERVPSPPTHDIDPERISGSQDTIDDGQVDDPAKTLQQSQQQPSQAAFTDPCQPSQTSACPQPQLQQRAPAPNPFATSLLPPTFIEPQHILKVAGSPPPSAAAPKRRVRYAHRSSSRLGVHLPAVVPQTPSPTPSVFFAACARADAKMAAKAGKGEEEKREEQDEQETIAEEVEWKSRRIMAGLAEWFTGWTSSSPSDTSDGEGEDDNEVTGGMNAREMESLCPIAGVQGQFY
ncbi:hypothetical protein I350_07980 [Cryptococcus amylolentus CBS 6273]|uniref:Uncharacterized protein n=1 Tax=Cryptococcus amylolentus CBS 6273 TaxID=1296118 RepID=A0A1E3J839_9TREE|nr:hypothetical protein I350_07980 [Cryptococcus amylolentus CBS 6273]